MVEGERGGGEREREGGVMPKEMERKLRRAAVRKFGSASGKRGRAYVYGSLRKVGWKPRKKSR